MEPNQNGPLNNLAADAHLNAITKGFWQPFPDKERPFRIAVSVALISVEASEALEAVREGNMENFVEELADVIIRTLDLAAYLGIDMDGAVNAKMVKNKDRPYKHGKKF